MDEATETCFTFQEANLLLDQVLPYKDLTLFLQDKGFVDNFGKPFDSYYNKDFFKCVPARGNSTAQTHHWRLYFITEEGMREFFKIALIQYALEQKTSYKKCFA